MDDLGVDLCHTDPFYIQCKAVEAMGSSHDTLSRMPDVRGKFNLVFHKKNGKGTVVSMSEDDFVAILKLMIKHGAVKPC